MIIPDPLISGVLLYSWGTRTRVRQYPLLILLHSSIYFLKFGTLDPAQHFFTLGTKIRISGWSSLLTHHLTLQSLYGHPILYYWINWYSLKLFKMLGFLSQNIAMFVVYPSTSVWVQAKQYLLYIPWPGFRCKP